MIRRKLQETIEARMFGGKAIIIIGARQVGDSRYGQQNRGKICRLARKMLYHLQAKWF